MTTGLEARAARCWSCTQPIDGADHYCRHCGRGQGAYLDWYYRPLWIIVLAFTLLGPLALPLVWRSPLLDRTGKWLASAVIVAITIYIGLEVATVMRQLTPLLEAR